MWLEREGPKHANDDMILERLALAVRHPLRAGHAGPRQPPGPRRRARRVGAGRPAGGGGRPPRSAQHRQHRVVAAPLFALWASRPGGPEDVVATAFGSMHAVVVPASCSTVEATSAGVGIATDVEHLPHSFRTAVVALRLCSPPGTPVVNADEYGGLVGLLADSPSDAHIPDVELLDEVMKHTWACPTLDVLIRAGSLRQAARLGGVHHSTMQTRVDTIAEHGRLRPARRPRTDPPRNRLPGVAAAEFPGPGASGPERELRLGLNAGLSPGAARDCRRPGGARSSSGPSGPAAPSGRGRGRRGRSGGSPANRRRQGRQLGGGALAEPFGLRGVVEYRRRAVTSWPRCVHHDVLREANSPRRW